MSVSTLYILTITKMCVYLLGSVSKVGLFLPGSSTHFLSHPICGHYLGSASGAGASAIPFLELAKQITRQAVTTRAFIWSESYWLGHTVSSCSVLAADASIITS